jgi:hypothetical protein
MDKVKYARRLPNCPHNRRYLSEGSLFSRVLEAVIFTTIARKSLTEAILSIENYINALAITGAKPEMGQLKIKGSASSPKRTLPDKQQKKPPEMPGRLDAAVNAGSILSFVDNVGASERSDILFSVQFAQRAADAICDRFAETRTWYGKFNEVLEAIGWATEQYAFVTHDQGQGSLRMDKAALSVIAAIASGNQLQVITASIAALEKLSDKDKAITLFDYYSTTDLSGNFQIGAVQRSKTGALSMALGAFYFRAPVRQKKFLFFEWGSSEVNFWTAAQKMTFNIAIYAKVRRTIEQKLGASAVDHIASIQIE